MMKYFVNENHPFRNSLAKRLRKAEKVEKDTRKKQMSQFSLQSAPRESFESDASDIDASSDDEGSTDVESEESSFTMEDFELLESENSAMQTKSTFAGIDVECLKIACYGQHGQLLGVIPYGINHNRKYDLEYFLKKVMFFR